MPGIVVALGGFSTDRLRAAVAHVRRGVDEADERRNLVHAAADVGEVVVRVVGAGHVARVAETLVKGLSAGVDERRVSRRRRGSLELTQEREQRGLL